MLNKALELIIAYVVFMIIFVTKAVLLFFLWRMFIVPLGVKSINVWHAGGLLLLFYFPSNNGSMKNYFIISLIILFMGLTFYSLM